MAGKLTPEKKVLNKEATKLRNAAYTQRRDAYRNEMKAAQNAILAGELGRASDESGDSFDAALAAKRAAEAVIEEKIRALREELERVSMGHSTIIEQARDARNLASTRKYDAIKEAERAINARYPDMDGCWSAGAWKSIDEFVPLVKAG